MSASAFETHQRARWMRPDAHRWIRPDVARFLKPGVDVVSVYPALARIEKKYRPDQPRVPAGNPDGGQWTDENNGPASTRKPTSYIDFGGLPSFSELFRIAPVGETNDSTSNDGGTSDSGANGNGANDPRIISDADPESVRAGEQYAQNGRRGGGRVLINGQQFELTPAQGARLSSAQARAAEAAARVREIEPNWRPPPSLYQTPDGLIRAYETDTLAAQMRANELAFSRGLPRPYASDTLPTARRSMEAYRIENGLRNLFGENDGTVAVSVINGRVVFGSSSSLPTYTRSDREIAQRLRDDLVGRYPEIFRSDNLGRMPNNALFHAETTTLLRGASGGSLIRRSLEVFVDRPMCPSCRVGLPHIGRELGNPTVTFVGPTGARNVMSDGLWIVRTRK